MSRGNWNIERAVFARWTEKKLDAEFTKLWPASYQNATDLLAFNKDEARAARGGNEPHPRPYCIFETSQPIVVSNASGTRRDEITQIQDAPYQFTIYGQTERQAIDLAIIVAAAFDRAALAIESDTLLDVFRDPDYGQRLDDQTWIRILPYRARIEATYNGPLS